MKKKIVILPGDGIGPEVTREAIKVMESVGEKAGIDFEIKEFPIGGICIDKYDIPLQEETIEICKKADAVFLGAVGGPKWDNLPKEKRPETGLLQIRKELGLFTNLRPVKIFPPLIPASSLKPEIAADIDILVVRELTGGIYFGQPKFINSINGEDVAVDTMEYKTSEIERIAHVAFKAARERKKKVTSVDKANVLVSSQLWRKTVERIAKDYSDVKLEHMLVDNCAMQLVRNPEQFDVLLTTNVFGDILSDEASMLTGSIGMLASASLGDGVGLYEPVHGSAPDIAGKNLANPLAAIGSIALMYRFSFKMEQEAEYIEKAIQSVLDQGYRSVDIYSEGCKKVTTSEMGDRVLEKIMESSI